MNATGSLAMSSPNCGEFEVRAITYLCGMTDGPLLRAVDLLTRQLFGFDQPKQIATRQVST